MRSTLSLLREDAARSTLPQPRLADLPDLLTRAEASGVRGHLDLALGEGPDANNTALPAAVELTAYRVVQEALTNVLRHAQAQRVWVSVRLTSSDLVVRVCDDGRGSASGVAEGGFGLVGMRERTEALGGTFTAGPRRSDGFDVSATFPLDVQDTASRSSA